jgi:hypothetical protein
MWVLERKKKKREGRFADACIEIMLTIKARYNVNSDNHENALNGTGKYAEI